MKTVQKQYKNSTKTSNRLLFAGRSAIQKLYQMAVPLLFLFVTSCSKPQAAEVEYENQVTETRALCDEYSGCASPFISVKTKVFIVNGCEVTATYTVKLCPGVGVTISNMSYTFANSPACNSTKQIWNTYYFAGQSQTANEAINVFYNQITLLIEADVIASLNPLNAPPLLQWIETYCHKLCVKGDGENPEFIELSQVPCGKGCCIRDTKLIVKDGVVVKGESAIINYGVCVPIPIVCDGILAPLSCSPACARIK
ncbi:MAG TPA: hypothetical protein PKD16_00095 [Saprospiraceae bacterium]|jgi:hypothetical protein|nr:hypothetical protein [Saprospiraceae bacterium]HMT68524.1 hypothetical protein [Saprospiraceae bacterium]